MKTTIKLLYVTFAGIFILALFSFTKNRLSSRNEDGTRNNKAAIASATGNTIAGAAVALTSDGTNSLVYTTGGILFKVIGSSFKETHYTFSKEQDEITYTASLYSNGIITNRYTYKVNASGLASSIISEQFDNGKPWLSWSDSCTYNTSGQLTRQFNGNGHSEFIYDESGDLSKVRYYNFQNKLLKSMVIHYSSDSTPLIADRNNLAPENIELDSYLQIFGRFSNHLPARIEYTDNATGGDKTDYSYSYVLDDKGYILSTKKYITGSGKIIDTKNFTYKPLPAI